MELDQTREERYKERKRCRKMRKRLRKGKKGLQNKLRRREGWLWVFVGG